MSVQNDNPWKRLMPICLMWGNDPELTEDKYNHGERPMESRFNPKAMEPYQRHAPTLDGWDMGTDQWITIAISSCISCHSTASNPHQPLKPKSTGRTIDWFRNIKHGEKFKPGVYSLDHSLQMSAGIQNYQDWEKQWGPMPYIFPMFKGYHTFVYTREAVTSDSDKTNA